MAPFYKMDIDFNAESQPKAVDRRSKKGKHSKMAQQTIPQMQEEIPQVEQPNSSSHNIDDFNCFAPQPGINALHEQSLNDSIADPQKLVMNVAIEQSAEIELADDKTVCKSEEESLVASKFSRAEQQEHLLQQIQELLTQKQELQEQISGMQQQITALQAQPEGGEQALRDELQGIRAENEQLRQQAQEQQQHQSGDSEKAREIELLGQQLAALQLKNAENERLAAENGRLAQKMKVAQGEQLQQQAASFQSRLDEAQQNSTDLISQIQAQEQQIEELREQLLQYSGEQQQTPQIARPPRDVRYIQHIEDAPDLFPLHFNSQPQVILNYLDNAIKQEEQQYPALPSYRKLLYAAVRYQLIYSCSELKFMKNDSLFQELLLTDFNDNQIKGMYHLDLQLLNEVKMKIATGQFEQAAEAAEKAGFFGVAQLICPGRKINPDNVMNALPPQADTLKETLSLLTSNSDNFEIQNQFHALGLLITLRSKLSFAEFKFRILSLLRNETNQSFKQIILIAAGIPCFYSAPYNFQYIQTGKSNCKDCHFQSFLQKMAKEFVVPTLEDFRLTEIYEYCFAKSHVNELPNRIEPAMITIQHYNEDLSQSECLEAMQTPADRILSYFAFFPHLLPMKAAYSGISRKMAQKDKIIAKTALFYAEIVIKNIKMLLQYNQQAPGDEGGLENNTFNDEFSVYETPVLPLKVTEQAVRHPTVGAAMQVWSNLGRFTANFRKELRTMTRENTDAAFAGKSSEIDLFYGREVSIPVQLNEIDEMESFGVEKDEISGLEVNDEGNSPFEQSNSSEIAEKIAELQNDARAQDALYQQTQLQKEKTGAKSNSFEYQGDAAVAPQRDQRDQRAAGLFQRQTSYEQAEEEDEFQTQGNRNRNPQAPSARAPQSGKKQSQKHVSAIEAEERYQQQKLQLTPENQPGSQKNSFPEHGQEYQAREPQQYQQLQHSPRSVEKNDGDQQSTPKKKQQQNDAENRPQPAFLPTTEGDELFATFTPPPIKQNVVKTYKEEKIEENPFLSQHKEDSPISMQPKHNDGKPLAEQPPVITADTGKKLSRKWSTKLKKWVQLDEKGNEIVPETTPVPPPPVADPFAVSEISQPSQASQSDSKRRGTGRYRAIQ